MKKAVSFSALVVLALLCGLWASRASAQAVFGNIFGTVSDPQGAAVAGAKVTVTDKNKGTTEETTTNESGNYSVTHLIPDPYSVKVEAQGFKSSEQTEVTVSADTGAKVDLALQLGSTSESVEVTSEAPQLKTDRADVATTFNQTYVEDLPIINRNFTQIELLSPGAQYLGWGHAATENPQGSQQIMVNGQHFSGTGYELDGTDNQDPILGIIVVNPNIDAITETKITTADYDAEFGKAVAGLVTVQTKSGTNALHGGAFWFRRTDATEARDPFNQFQKNPITGKFMPQDRWNQFGGTIGGPILKDKLFFFGDYQGTRQASGSSYSLTLPTKLVHDSCTGAGDGSGFCKLNQYASLIGSGAGSLIYDPNTSVDPNGNGRTAFCGPAGCATQPNWIPLNRVNPVAQNILSLLPLPTDPAALQNNFIASGSGPYSQNSFDTRIDFNASQSLQVFGRFSLARFSLSGVGLLGPMGGVGTGQLGLAGSAVTHNYSLASGFTKTLSSSLLTDFRFGYFKYNPTTHKPDEGKDAAKALGIPGLNNGDLFTSGLPTFDGLGPAINAGNDLSTFAMGDGLNVARCNCPLIESEQQFQFVNNWTKMRGNHQFKFGGDIRYAENLRVPSDANRTGELHFTQDNNHPNTGSTSDGGVGGSGFANFLLGDVNHMGRFVSTSTNAAERQKRWFFYGQDTWRATSKLTLNYGLRWEIYFPERVNAKGNGGFANPEEGIIRVAGYGKYGLNGNIDNTWKAFAPRLGVAYQVTPKTVVRLGYGRSFDMGVFGSNFGHAVTQNLPVLVNQQVTANNNGLPTVNNAFYPAFTLSQGPPAYAFPPIPSNGILPLGGLGNNVQPRMRPTFQRLPTLDAWNATVQHQLTNTMSLEVGYVGNKGTHVFAGNGPAYDLNQVPYGPGSAVVTTAGQAPGFTAATPPDQRRRFYNAFIYPDCSISLQQCGLSGLPVSDQLKCCTDGIMGNYFGNDANAHYNSLQIKFDKRFNHGLQFMSSYVFSHANNESVDGGYLYAVDRPQSRGPDDFSRNHVFIWNGVYQLPFGKGKAFAGDSGRAMDLLIGGWQLGDTVIWSSGLPWTANLNGSDCGQVSDTGPCLPNFNGSFHVGAGSFDKTTRKVTYYTPVSPLAYSAAALTPGVDTCTLARPTSGPFSLPACASGGNVGRNSFRGPGAITDNLSLSKIFHVTERFNAEFRLDAYNLFNHANLANPSTCVDCTDPNAGKITGLAASTSGISNNGMRYLQFGIKLGF